MLTSKERVQRAVHFRGPDRIPILHSFLPGGLNELGDELRGIFSRYPSDISGQYPQDYSVSGDHGWRYLTKGVWTDEWGCTWDFPGLGVEGIPVDGPFYRGWEKLNGFRCPEVGSEQRPPRDADERYVMAGIPGGRMFERMHFLRGYENLMIDLAEDRQEVYLLRDRILEWTVRHLGPMLKCGWIDCFCYMDDWGTQTGLMISPPQWRAVFKPVYTRLFSMVREAGKDVYFHSDGMIIDMIPDLVKMGVSILNCQISCMDLGRLAAFKGKVCFATDIDRQHLLPFGSPEEIRNHIRALIRTLSLRSGGMIGEAEIGPGVPAHNAEVAYRTLFEFRWE